MKITKTKADVRTFKDAADLDGLDGGVLLVDAQGDVVITLDDGTYCILFCGDALHSEVDGLDYPLHLLPRGESVTLIAE